MKNRPVVTQANQYKDVYGSQKRSTRTVISVLLTAVNLIIIIAAIINDNKLMLWIFIPLLIILLISFFVARRADKQNAPAEPSDHPEAIFKDHDL